MRIKSLIILGVFLFLACKPQNKDIPSISVEELQTQLTKDIQLVDVRTPTEWERGIINGALKINVTSNDFETKSEELLNKSKPVYLYCRTGGRSLRAAEILKHKGFKVYNINGGYNEWKDKFKK